MRLRVSPPNVRRTFNPRGAGSSPCFVSPPQALKAYGLARLFTSDERPKPLALAAGNGGAALIGLVLPGRFDDAMRIAVVRRYPPCPCGVRALCLSLVMLGLIDSAALAPAGSCRRRGRGRRERRARRPRCRHRRRGAAAALIIAPPRLVGKQARLASPTRPLAEPGTTSLRRASQAWALVSACWLEVPSGHQRKGDHNHPDPRASVHRPSRERCRRSRPSTARRSLPVSAIGAAETALLAMSD
jgi:hypothetical protein